MAGQLRPYPELHGLSSMTPEQVSHTNISHNATANKQQKAHATLVALCELHDIGHPVVSNDHTSIGSGLLGLEALHNLAASKLLTDEYGYNVPTVHQWYGDAIKNGSAWFARWTTDHILKLRLSGRMSNDEWTQHVQGFLLSVMQAFERATAEIDTGIVRNGLKET